MKVNKFFFAFAVFFLFCLFFFLLFGVARAQARSLPLNDELLTLNKGDIQSLEPKSGLLLSSLVDTQDLKQLGGDDLNLEDNGLLAGNINIKNVNSSKNVSNMKALLLLNDNLKFESSGLSESRLKEQKIRLGLKDLSLNDQNLLLQGLSVKNLRLLNAALEV